MPLDTGRIHQGDCLQLMKQISGGSIDLAFADPPFNIGYKYDKYLDSQEDAKYLDWCQTWIIEIHRILKPNGTFWLAIGDEYAAELKVAATRSISTPFIMRGWVVWYYTFGVNCTRKFNRSHAHLFQFIKDDKSFTFNAEDPLVRVKSARELVYGDNRANPTGRLPDDTWVLRPQDYPQGFQPMDDTWYYSRVAGTFKERQGFHGCQMPEQLLGRIIRVSSKVGDTVFDPFTGSGTTLAVAKKLGRNWIGCELSADYAKYSSQRLSGVRFGDPLDGPADPASSSPNTANGVRLVNGKRQKASPHDLEPSRTKFVSVADAGSHQADHATSLRTSVDLTSGVIEAFRKTHHGQSIDRLLADPVLGDEFVARCQTLGVPGGEVDWKRALLRTRKAGKLNSPITMHSRITWESLDSCTFASEIAWKSLKDNFNVSLDDILCDPTKTREFDRIARRFAPGFSSFDYRWAALMLRKRARNVRSAAASLPIELAQRRLSRYRGFHDFDASALLTKTGVYALCSEDDNLLYIGETLDIGRRLSTHQQTANEYPNFVSFAYLETPYDLRKGKQSRLIKCRHPLLNIPDLAA